MFRKITNANELKYLDEFLLNKVGQPGPRASPESLAVLQTTWQFCKPSHQAFIRRE